MEAVLDKLEDNVEEIVEVWVVEGEVTSQLNTEPFTCRSTNSFKAFSRRYAGCVAFSM